MSVATLHPQFPFGFRKFLDRKREVCLCVRRGDLSADTGLALGNHGIRKTDHVDTLRQHAVGKRGRQRRLAQQHRHNRVGAWKNVEAEARQFFPEIARVCVKLMAQFGG